jgi:hypothetical protein
MLVIHIFIILAFIGAFNALDKAFDKYPQP